MRYVIEAIYQNDYKIKLRFDSNEVFVVDFRHLLQGEIFAPLKDLAVFSKFVLHPDLETLTWENGADFAPEFLYEQAKKQSKQSA